MNVRYIRPPGSQTGPWTKHSRQNAWIPTSTNEIYLFIGMLVFMAESPKTRVADYWQTKQSNRSASMYVMTKYMSRDRFEALYRRFCVWDTTETYTTVFDKVKRWSLYIQDTSTRFWKPASKVSVDEAMVKYTGRSKDIVHMPAKPIPLGYKIWVVADAGYFLRWSFHMKGDGPVGYNGALYPGLAPTQGIVADLLSRLPPPPSPQHGYHCFMDNLFSSTELFQLLRDRGIAATGTTRPNRIDSHQMQEVRRQEKAKDSLPWGTFFAKKHKTQEVMQFAFKDNALVLAMSTHYSGWEPSPLQVRKRPTKTSTSAKTARAPFGERTETELPFPPLLNDYNFNMNGVDIGDQLRTQTATQRRSRRGGQQPLLRFLLDVVLGNCFLLQREGWPSSSKLRCKSYSRFLQKLSTEIFTRYGEQVALYSAHYGAEASHLPEAPRTLQRLTHTKVKRQKRAWCANCSSKRQNKILDRPDVLKVQRKHLASKGCLECDVALCKNCWESWHA
jgi:hypothetical protein